MNLRTRRNLLTFALSSALILGGCAAITAQNPGGALTPVNAHALEGQRRVMLKGHDVVAYFTQNKHAMGSPQFMSTYEGVNFWFSSAAHKAMFDQDPSKYLPQYGGYCANGIVYGIPWGGDPDTWLIHNGKLYIFGGPSSRDGFLLDLNGNVKLADKYWNEEVKGSNSFWQRSKRLILRVPHYKTSEQLAKEIAAAKKS